jgi:adenylate cyclase
MIEIERKFLVHAELLPDLNSFEKNLLKQAYLQKSEKCTVRVRWHDDRAFLTIKGKSTRFSRPEFEYEIPKTEAESMFEMASDNCIEKTRYLIPIGDKTWEVDVFSGSLNGLILAEVELKSEDEALFLPNWIAEEVSLDNRYFNSSLSKLSAQEAYELISL